MTFKPGQSGNPAGRRPGQVTTVGKLRKAVEEALPEVIKKVIEAAKEGDMNACKILIDKAIPTPKAQALPVAVPIGADLSETGGNIVAATLDGKIPPDIGSQLIAALAAQARIVEIDDLNKRLEALENQGKVDDKH